jgi:hypothetical protein
VFYPAPWHSPVLVTESGQDVSIDLRFLSHLSR